ncbi:MAG TPA: adenine phosphoribosyltransferase [Tissierellaceae bacterium]|nr:adenine phosphoribosyltransferase [Tissierellaceae bacterium]
MDLKSKIRVIEDFPVEGISFKDITTLIKDKDAFKHAVELVAKDLEEKEVDYIAGPEARGFLFGAAVAYSLGIGFIPVRKPGKLPGGTIGYEYDLEYGTNRLEIHKDAIEKGKKVAIVDDLLATGGTMLATAKLIEELGGKVVAMEFLIELESLKGREKLKNYYVNSLVKYDK